MSDGLSFGRWLKQRRNARDLTQEALGERVGCAAETIRRFEGDRLRPSRETALRLAQQLGLADGERDAFVRAARSRPELRTSSGDGAGPTAAVQPLAPGAWERRQLPAPTAPLVGRAHEVTFACALLRQTAPRLLTLTGAGGTGKTRVALEVARTAASGFGDGVAFVALDAIVDPALVGNVIGQALGVTEQGGQPVEEALKRYLHDKHLLLVLDNFEQILDAAPLVADLLASAARLKVLVTSRAPLHLTGEHECPVLPLPVPQLERLPPYQALTQYAAVELFVQRVQAVQPAFQLNDANARDVATICCRLDGIPLALILAAAWCKLFRPADLIARLSSGVTLRTTGGRDLPSRQQTLRATVDWSYRLLNSHEQRLFRWLAVFAGGCTLEAAEAVCTADGKPPVDVVAALQGLLDKSLLQRTESADGTPRLRMLETIREYALEQLSASGETAPMRRHAGYFCRLAELAQPESIGPQQLVWLRRLETECDNLRAALRWSLDHGAADIAARLSTALQVFWYFHGHVSEGRQWLAEVLAQSAVLAPSTRANNLCNAGLLAWLSGDHQAARAPLEQSLALFRQQGDKSGTAFALIYIAGVRVSEGSNAAARESIDESLAILRELGDGWTTALALHQLGFIHYAQGDYAAARESLQASADLFQAHGDSIGATFALSQLGNATAFAGDYAAAYPALALGATHALKVGNKTVLLMCLGGLAAVAAAIGTAEHVARMYGALSSLQEQVQVPFAPQAPLLPGGTGQHDHNIVAARAKLGEIAFAAAWVEGRTMTLEQAVAYALDVNVDISERSGS